MNWFEAKYANTLDGLLKVSSILLRRFRETEVQKHPSRKRKNEQTGQWEPLQYLDTSACIDRLDEAFTSLGWSYQTSDPIYPPKPSNPNGESIVEHNVAVRGTLTIHMPWGNVVKEQFGSSVLKSLWDGDAKKFGTQAAYNQQSAEFGDDLKSAGSDALKKCATLLGVYNYQSRKGKNAIEDDAKAILEKLVKRSEELKWSRTMLLSYCGGIICKTINGAEDLTAVQAQACLNCLMHVQADGDQFQLTGSVDADFIPVPH